MAHRHVELGLKLPQLQNLIKRDPEGYADDFERQYRHFQSELQIFLLKPNKKSARFGELVNFLGHVAPCFREDAKDLPGQLATLLERHGAVLDADLRRTMVQTLILLRNRDMYDAVELMRLAFRLFRIPDKSLRKLLKDHISVDMRNANDKRRNEGLNRKVQALVDGMLTNGTEGDVAAKKGLDIAVDLYRRRIWTDARTVNIIGRALLHAKPRIFITAHNFFLGIDRIMADDEEDEEKDEAEAAGLNAAGGLLDRRTGGVTVHNHSKKTAKRLRAQEKQKRNIRIARRKLLGDKDGEPQPRFPALTLLHDPQGLAEDLFRKLRASRDKFKTRLLMMNLLTRLVGHHKLMVLSLYAFLQRYITGHQQEVTHVLAFLVQCTHELVPPEELLPTLKAVANAFVADRCPPESIAVGINTLRELITRAPALLSEDGMDDFCQDIAAYSKYRDRSVVMAARGFLNAVRNLHPTLLKRKDRGKFHNPNAKPTEYGSVKVVSNVPGAALLQLEREGLISIDEEGELVVRIGDEDEGSDAGSDADEIVMEGTDDDDDEGDDEEAQEAKPEDEEDGAKEDAAVEDDDDDDDEEVPDLIPMQEEAAGEADGGPSLTQEDFERIAELKEKVLAKLQEPGFRTQCERRGNGEYERLLAAVEGTEMMAATADDDEEDDIGESVARAGNAVEAADLAGMQVKRRKTLEERLESVLKGRSEKFKPQGHAGGLTNREKARKKNFLMVRKGRSMAQKLQNAARLVRKRQDGNAKKVLARDKRKRRRT